MKEWHFNILFAVGVGGAVVVLIAPWIHLDIGNNPTAITGVGAILTYILTQKKTLTKPPDEPKNKDDPSSKEGE